MMSVSGLIRGLESIKKSFTLEISTLYLGGDGRVSKDHTCAVIDVPVVSSRVELSSFIDYRIPEPNI